MDGVAYPKATTIPLLSDSTESLHPPHSVVVAAGREAGLDIVSSVEVDGQIAPLCDCVYMNEIPSISDYSSRCGVASG
jgi:hypothetical protein